MFRCCSAEAVRWINERRLGKRSVKVSHKEANKKREKYHMIAKYLKGACDRAGYLKWRECMAISLLAEVSHDEAN